VRRDRERSEAPKTGKDREKKAETNLDTVLETFSWRVEISEEVPV
jgi:hypothetical protein